MLCAVAQELGQQEPPPQATASNQRYETGTPNGYSNSVTQIALYPDSW